MIGKKIGETVYIVSNGVSVMSGIIRGISKEFCILVLEDGSSTRLRTSKIFETKAAAEEKLKRHKMLLEEKRADGMINKNNPYAYID